MTDCVDFSWNRPTADELQAAGVGALIYDKTFGNQGSPEKYRAGLAAAGIMTAGIHEESGTEAFDGHDRGVRAAVMADRAFADGVFVYYCAADKRYQETVGHEAAISDYFRGVGETTREPEVGAYGPLNGLRAAQAGSVKVTKLWGVETWHPQARNNGDPFNVDLWRGEGVHLLQMVGPSPIGGTDFDLALKPDWANTKGWLMALTDAEQADLYAKVNALFADATAAGGGVDQSGASNRLVLEQIKAGIVRLEKSGAGGSGELKVTLTGTASP